MSPNPIVTVRASGDPFDIGAALGRAGAEALRQRVFATEEYRTLDARWRGSSRMAELEAASRAVYPRYVREIEGIAEGAGQSFETLFLWNCRGDLRLPEGLSPAAQAAAASGCTTLEIPAEGDGPAIIAHNEDGDAKLLGACLWVEVEAEGEPAWKSFMYPGMLCGHTFGANDAGVVQTINNIRANDLQPGIPRQIVCRAILAARSLEDALDVLRRTDRASGFHHNLGEARTRRVVSVEAPASGCDVREVEAPMAHANHLLRPAFEGLAQTVTVSSRTRQAAADRHLAAGDLAGGPEAILFDRDSPIHVDQSLHDDYSQTLATVVFRMSPDRVDWTIHASPEERDALGGTIPVA